MPTKVRITTRKSKENTESMYLSFSPPITNDSGNAVRRESINMQRFIKPKNKAEKEHNKINDALAEEMRVKRWNELNKLESYSRSEKEEYERVQLGKQGYLEFFQALGKTKVKNDLYVWKSVHDYLTKFCIEYKKTNIKINQLNEKFFDDFKLYLQSGESGKTLAINTIHNYYTKIKQSLIKASYEGMITDKLRNRVSNPKKEDTKREYLTIEELKRLVVTECTLPVLKQGALFSALTGLRYGDVKAIKWDQIEYIKGSGYYLHFRMGKTGKYDRLPISEDSLKVVGAPLKELKKHGSVLDGDRLMLEGFHVHTFNSNHHFNPWIKKAGIIKHVTYHCMRHSYATNQLINGARLETVSSMLGHANLQTTKIYAKVVDSMRQETINNIDLAIK